MVIFYFRQDANYLRLVLLTSILLLMHMLIYSQNRQASIWHVGNKKLDFNTNPITVTDVVSPFLGTKSSIALSDSNGNYILFASTQTQKLYDNNYNEITNGSIIAEPKQQGIIFIPKPYNHNEIYCIFSNKYSFIDIQNYTVIEENQTWDNSNILNLYAIHHANCNDIWLVSQHSDGFYSYLVSNSGISNTPMFSPSQNLVDHRGTFSSNGKYYAIPNKVTDTVLIDFGKFNRQTGVLTKTISYKFNNYQMCYASAFSQDETKLYLFMQIRNSSNYHLFQVNIINGFPDFSNAIIISSQSLGGFSTFISMQLGIDGKIYQSYYFTQKKINIIHNPNAIGVACNYEDNAIPLTTITNNLPIFIDTWFSPNYCELDFFLENYCQTDNTQFYINNSENISTVLWNFGDSQTSTELEPMHIYASAGIYTVTLEVTFTDNSTQTITKEIEIFDKPLKPTIEHE